MARSSSLSSSGVHILLIPSFSLLFLVYGVLEMPFGKLKLMVNNYDNNNTFELRPNYFIINILQVFMVLYSGGIRRQLSLITVYGNLQDLSLPMPIQPIYVLG